MQPAPGTTDYSCCRDSTRSACAAAAISHAAAPRACRTCASSCVNIDIASPAQ